MISRAERNAQVTPEGLEQRADSPATRAKPATTDELAALRARIAGARTLRPAVHEVHCRDCFEKGRDAALRAIEGDAEA